MTLKLSDYVMRFLANQGVKHVFLLPGGGCMHLVESLGACPDLEYVCNLHEQACAIAAEAYGEYTSNLGVCLVTTGPGGTNAITGLAAAWLDSTPCLFISGQVKRADLIGQRGVRQMGFQEIDIISLVKPITKYAQTVIEPESIRYHLEKAVFMAKTGRPGPVWIDIPLDVQAAKLDEAGLASFIPEEAASMASHRKLSDQVKETLTLINQAERPVILAGNGVRLAQALAEFKQLIQRLNIPVLTTWKAMDFLPESHSLYIGRPGAVASRGANFAQQNADWILTIGARLDLGQTGFNHNNFARAAKKIVVDVDPAEIGKLMMPVAVPIAADAGDFLQECLRQLDSLPPKDLSAWWERCREWKDKYPVILPEFWQETQRVSNYVLVDVLSDEMIEDDILVPGSSGACSEITMQAFRVKPNQRVLNAQGLGAMGFGIPAALGGCLASGRRRTICLDGDGGFQLNLQELETVQRLNLPIKFFVLNNNGYGSIRATQMNYFGRLVASSPESGLTLPDLQKIARAYNIPAATICNHSHIRQQVRQVLETEGPVICEVLISPNQTTMPRLSSAQRPDGSMVSKPMEDLWPFLDREEFANNMLIPLLEE